MWIFLSALTMSDVFDKESFKRLKLTTTEHFLRYVSECDPSKGKAKGGYLVGRVNVPFKGKKLVMTIDVVPSKKLHEKITKDLKDKFTDLSSEDASVLAMTHPNLVHHFRFEMNGTNRACDKEFGPFNHSWKLEYSIDENKDIKIRKYVDADRKNDAEEEKVGKLSHDDKGFFFLLTKNEGQTKLDPDMKFCLAPLRPNKRQSSEITIDGVLNDRLSHVSQKVRNFIKSFYLNKNAEKIWMFRLRVQFRAEASSEEEEIFISGDIRDTRSDSMEILGITNKKSCYSGNRLITIKSMWDLDKKKVKPENDYIVKPWLQVYDRDGKHLKVMTEKLNQPSKIEVEKGFVDFRSPSQTEDTIKEIYYDVVGTEKKRNGNTIKLLLKRSDSGFESNKKVTFAGDNFQKNTLPGSCFRE